jgi:hypothetical protein
MIATTSVENYRAHRDSGKLGEQAQAIVDFLARHGSRDWSRAELSEALDMRLSSVCGRVNELLRSRHIDAAPVRPCSVTGKRVNTVRKVGTVTHNHI